MVAAAGIGLSTAPSSLARNEERPGIGDSVGPTAVPAAGTFYPVSPQRLLGTGSGGYPLPPGAAVSVPVAGHGSLPSSGMSAVLVNVTTVSDGGSTLSLAPAGSSASGPLVTVSAGTTSTLLTIPLAPAGWFGLTASERASVAVDVVGFYAADDTVVASSGVSGGYQPVEPTVLHDSDTAPLEPGGSTRLAVDLGGAINPHATALLLKVTAKGATSAGSLTVSPATGAQSGSVFFGSGTTSANLAVVAADPDAEGRLRLVVGNTSPDPVGVHVDLIGFYDDGALGPNLRFRTLPQTRVVDTATALGGGPLQPGRRTTVTPPASVVGASTFGLVGVLTGSAGGPASLGLDDADSSSSRFDTLPLSPLPTSLAVQPEVGAGGRLALSVPDGASTVSATMDVVGSFEAYPPVANPAARGWVSPVSSWEISAQGM
jgi:hypothetical protein